VLFLLVLFSVAEIFLTKRTTVVTLRRRCIRIFSLVMVTLSVN